ncbi:MAG: COX15/CtaA family protein [Gemmatimonadaceae bacterium]|nr:COX15/CtaA family protein [Gemmatimonadaceae bacterium]
MPTDDPPLAHRRLANYAWAVLGFNLLVILWGAYVRASGSGAGCGAHWPLCNGEVVPRAVAVATRIEFTHRVTSGLAFLAVAVLMWRVRRAVGVSTAARRAAYAAMALMVTEALVGAGLVLFEMVAQNASIARAWWLAAHLMNTFALLAALVLTPWWLAGHAPPDRARVRAERRWVAPLLLGALLVGVTGAVTALGDTLFPAQSLAEGLRQDVSETAHLLVRLRVWHPAAAVVLAIGAWWCAGYATRRRPDGAAARPARWVRIAVVTQIALGVVNLILLAPIPLQLLHLLGADLTWLALILLGASAVSQPRVTSSA